MLPASEGRDILQRLHYYDIQLDINAWSDKQIALYESLGFQVSTPEKRGFGLGQAIVRELLLRLKGKADFITVSGQIDNATDPEALYRKCGFTGNDIWCVVQLACPPNNGWS